MTKDNSRPASATDAPDQQADAPTKVRYAHEGQPPGYLWERAEDRCHLCRVRIGFGLRFLHRGLCDTCAAKPKH
jgi:hypothetical protein